MTAKEKAKYKIQFNVNGEWVDGKEFNTTAELVRYSNNYHGYSHNYNRVKYHLNRYKEHQFDYKCGVWNARFIKEVKTIKTELNKL